MTGSVHFHTHDDGDGIARVVLDNPTKLNAINIAMWRELRRVFDYAASAEHREGVTAFIEKRSPRFRP